MKRIHCKLFLYILLILQMLIHPSEAYFLAKKEDDTQIQVYSKQLQSHVQKKARIYAKVLMYGNTYLLLKGNMALPALATSMIATRLLEEDANGQFDSTSFKVFVSFCFSGLASLSGWLLNTLNEQGLSVSRNKKEMTFLHALLVLGSRGMELVGGTLLLFLNILKH